MTFVQYARSRRMGLAFKEILAGKKVIDQQVSFGYESSSAFNDAFTKIMGNPPKHTDVTLMSAKVIATPIGRMLSLTDGERLYLLEFMDRRGLEREIEKLRIRYNARILFGETKLAVKLEEELEEYFHGARSTFTIPLQIAGTSFQEQVWQVLKEIPPGETWSYQDIANKLGNSKLVRAIGNANGRNQIAILIPCHRVIKTNGEIGGYGGGVSRKKYLLELEAVNVDAK
ncbi:methylated-DNA--protein-cysteine methyltransferase [Listeria floridensis FSL S10-1187]|uniref:Methylated-DNA--protein-cysteine methyltransferase n=1 Tax=Listeria floridensis FSL S10-1187 TaxID=1265817 RepID=A0ABP3AVV9_9LIST|nr:methylated-DNA--protein-cysteine methyltransferase [Listeria floridensis FSL S10-1187]